MNNEREGGGGSEGRSPIAITPVVLAIKESIMFKGLVQLGALLKQAQQIGGQMEKLTEEMKSRRTTGTAGGGMVEVEINGLLEVLRCRIDPQLVAQGDRELIEDLLVAAMNQAVAKAQATPRRGPEGPDRRPATARPPGGPGEARRRRPTRSRKGNERHVRTDPLRHRIDRRVRQDARHRQEVGRAAGLLHLAGQPRRGPGPGRCDPQRQGKCALLPQLLQLGGRGGVRDLPRPAPRAGLLCVVEQPRDLMALEQAGIYRGLYHVLLGRMPRWKGSGRSN